MSSVQKILILYLKTGLIALEMMHILTMMIYGLTSALIITQAYH